MVDYIAPPNVVVYSLEDKEIPDNAIEYLKVRKNWYQISYTGSGGVSAPFIYDTVEKKYNDAVVIVAHAVISRVRVVYLRSCIRPALNKIGCVSIWELAAGLVEGEEKTENTAARETMEELGFDIGPADFKQLGEHSLPAIGICSERLYYYEIEVDPATQKKPSNDGSPLEKHGVVQYVSIDTALRLIKEGQLKDAKTEIGIRRLAERYGK